MKYDIDDEYGEDYLFDIDPNDKVKAILVYELIDHATLSDIKFLLDKNKDLYYDYLLDRNTKHCPVTEKYFENLSKSNKLDFSVSGVSSKDFAECFMKNYDEFQKQYNFDKKAIGEVTEISFSDDYKYTPFIDELYEHIDNQSKEKSILENNYPDDFYSSIISHSHPDYIYPENKKFDNETFESEVYNYYTDLADQISAKVSDKELKGLLNEYSIDEKEINHNISGLKLAKYIDKYDIDHTSISLSKLSHVFTRMLPDIKKKKEFNLKTGDMKNNIKDFLLKDILPKINSKGINNLIENANYSDTNTIFFKDFLEHTKTGSEYSPEELSDAVKTNLSDFKLYADDINIKESIKGKRELTYKEQINIKEGDYVSHRNKNREFLKGKVIEVKDGSYIIENKEKGEIEIPRDFTIKFFNGQKFDAREIGYNLLNLNIGKASKTEVDLSNVLRNFNLNSNFLNFSDLDKVNRLRLLKGQETSVIHIRAKITQGDKIVNKVEKIRLKAYKHDGELHLQKIKGFDNSIYGTKLKEEELKALKSGETLIFKDLKTKEGNSFNVAAYYDSGLDQVRVKNLNEDNLKSLKVLGNYDLNSSELEKLNTTGELKLTKTNKKGDEINYMVTYNKPLNSVKIKRSDKTKPEQSQKIDFPISKAEEYKEKRKNEIKEFNSPKKNKKPGKKIN